MNYTFIILITFLSQVCIFAQDEKIFREMMTYESELDKKQKVKKHYDFSVRSHRYILDLNEDSKLESFYTTKRDGEDWIHFFNDKNKLIYSYRFDTLGPWSRIFRVQLREIDKNTNVLLVYFYEGTARYIEFQGSSRLYLLTFDKKNLASMKMTKGPYLWNEHKSLTGHYRQRDYKVSMYDFDFDLKREVAVRYGYITRVIKYLGDGKWSKLYE